MANRIMSVMTIGAWIFLIVMFSLFGAEQLNRYRLWRAIENEDLAYIGGTLFHPNNRSQNATEPRHFVRRYRAGSRHETLLSGA